MAHVRPGKDRDRRQTLTLVVGHVSAHGRRPGPRTYFVIFPTRASVVPDNGTGYFCALDRSAIDTFYAADLVSDGVCDDPPGLRVHIIIPNPADWAPCWPVLQRILGDVRPAATLIHAGLQDPRMKIEIEVTARLPSG